jgi:hypothetical protein
MEQKRRIEDQEKKTTHKPTHTRPNARERAEEKEKPKRRTKQRGRGEKGEGEKKKEKGKGRRKTERPQRTKGPKGAPQRWGTPSHRREDNWLFASLGISPKKVPNFFFTERTSA